MSEFIRDTLTGPQTVDAAGLSREELVDAARAGSKEAGLQLLLTLAPAPRSLPPGAFDARHLAGKHNQKTHGRGGGGYKPGAWEKVSNEERVKQIQANLEEDLHPSVKAGMIERDGPDAVRQLAEKMAASNGVIYTNGEHKVHFTTDRLTDAEHKDFLANVDELQTLAPLDKPLNIEVAPSYHFRGGTGGECEVGTGNIRINEQVYTKYDRTGLMWGTKGWVMPMNERVSVSKYILAHEWGHAQDSPLGELNLSGTKGLSEYGQTNNREAFAEAFAEFVLSKGKTGNPAAQKFASVDKWGERWPSLATA